MTERVIRMRASSPRGRWVPSLHVAQTYIDRGDRVRVVFTLNASEAASRDVVEAVIAQLFAFIERLKGAQVIEAPSSNTRSVAALVAADVDPPGDGAGVREPRTPIVPVLSGGAARVVPVPLTPDA